MTTATTAAKAIQYTGPAYSYIRWSSEKQSAGDSLRRQTANAKAVAEANGWRLDPVTMRDMAISAFNGANAKAGALGGFLEAVEAGKIVPGSVLIVESLDRLSRQKPRTALRTFESIIDAGVAVYADGRMFTAESIDSNDFELTGVLQIMIRAHQESARKSQRVGSAWANKRANIMAKPLTSRVPGWVQLDKASGKLKLMPANAAIVRRIVGMALDGMGPITIAKTLNREGIKPFSGRAKGWSFKPILNWLRSPVLIGTFQPCTVVAKKQTPSGDAIRNYYPAVIDDATYYRLQSVLDTRATGTRGRSAAKVSNLFGRIMTSGNDGSVMHLVERRRDALVSYDARRGLSDTASFPYAPFENHFLAWVSELPLGELMGETPTEDKTSEIAGRLADVRERQGKITAAIQAATGRGIDPLVSLLAKLGTEAEQLQGELETAKAAANRPSVASTDIAKLVKDMATMTADKRVAIRTRLRSMIQTACKSIKLYTYHRGDLDRLAIADVELADSGLHRLFALRCQRGQQPRSIGMKTPNAKQAAKWDIKWMDSMAKDLFASPKHFEF